MFKTWFHSNSPSLSGGFHDICIFPYLGHKLDLFGSRDVITMTHVHLLFDISNTLLTYLLTYIFIYLPNRHEKKFPSGAKAARRNPAQLFQNFFFISNILNLTLTLEVW